MSARWAQAQAWWDGRTRREQGLLAIMAALLLAVVFWYGIVSPILGWRASGAERREQAAADLISVQSDVARLNAEAAVRPAATGEPIEPLLIRTAEAAGLPIQRQQAEADGAQTVWMVGVQPQPLFGWLATLEQAHGVNATLVTVLKSPTGPGLDVQASFRSSGS